MRQLIYSSRWTDEAKRDLGLTLQLIVGKSIQNNRLVDVTGFLLAQTASSCNCWRARSAGWARPLSASRPIRAIPMCG